MLPQGSVPAPEPVAETQAPQEYLPVRSYRRRPSLRARVLVFAVLAGGLLTFAISFVATVLMFAFQPTVLGPEPRPVIFTFVQLSSSMGPLLMLVAAVAAAADAMVKRSAHASHQASEDLARALQRLTRKLDGREDRHAPSGLNLEIDSDPEAR